MGEKSLAAANFSSTLNQNQYALYAVRDTAGEWGNTSIQRCHFDIFAEETKIFEVETV